MQAVRFVIQWFVQKDIAHGHGPRYLCQFIDCRFKLWHQVGSSKTEKPSKSRSGVRALLNIQQFHPDRFAPPHVKVVRYFTKRASMSQINRALQYIEENEEARWVKACKETARAGNGLRLRFRSSTVTRTGSQYQKTSRRSGLRLPSPPAALRNLHRCC